MLRVINETYNNLDKGNKTLTIFIDLQKAFDSISHVLLIEKLGKLGIRDNTDHKYLLFAKSYLLNRTQRVKIENTLSDPITVKPYGVPQGTVLGPLFFIIYINDIFNIPLNGNITCFADDTALTISAPSWVEAFINAEKDINLVKKWMDHNLLSMNGGKTNFITFSINTAGQPQNLTIKIHENICLYQSNQQSCNCAKINQVDEILYLGCKLDKFLNWKSQTNLTSKRIRKCIYKFRQLRGFLSIPMLRQMYFALVHSILQYGIGVWGGANQSNIQPVIRSLQITIRVILRKHNRYPSNLLYHELDVPTFQQTYMQALLNLTSCLSSTPLVLPPIIHHNHNTRRRGNQNLQALQITRNIYYCSPIYNASKFFNMLPLEIKNLRSSRKFKNEVKKWIKITF